jgi:peptide/nickel transport system substrate-binding protein
MSVMPTTSYVEGVVGQPRSFLPGHTITHNDKTISALIYRGLFDYDIYGTLIPDLAETWEISEDGMIYTIKLKADQYWIDGSKVTSDDLIYTAFNNPDLSDVATDRVDDLTVRYYLPNKFSPFLSLLTVKVMKANSLERANPLMPVTNGKFRVIRIEKSGPVIQQVTLWNNHEEEDIKKIVFRYYANEPEVATAARLGEVDGFIANSDTEIENFSEYKFPLQGVYYALYFNLRNDKFSNPDVRNRFEKVLPVKDLIFQEGILVQGPISRSSFTDKELEFEGYDEAFAGNNTGLSFTITVPDIKQHVEMARKIKEFWQKKLDVSVEIVRVDPDKFTEEVITPRNYEVLFYGQEIGRDPDRYVNWHSTQSDDPGLNLSGFTHVRSDRALEEGRNEVDSQKRIVHYAEFQKVINEQTPAIFLYHPYTKYYVKKNIKGIGQKYTFTYSDRFLDFSNWSKVRAL